MIWLFLSIALADQSPLKAIDTYSVKESLSQNPSPWTALWSPVLISAFGIEQVEVKLDPQNFEENKKEAMRTGAGVTNAMVTAMQSAPRLKDSKKIANMLPQLESNLESQKIKMRAASFRALAWTRSSQPPAEQVSLEPMDYSVSYLTQKMAVAWCWSALGQKDKARKIFEEMIRDEYEDYLIFRKQGVMRLHDSLVLLFRAGQKHFGSENSKKIDLMISGKEPPLPWQRSLTDELESSNTKISSSAGVGFAVTADDCSMKLYWPADKKVYDFEKASSDVKCFGLPRMSIGADALFYTRTRKDKKIEIVRRPRNGKTEVFQTNQVSYISDLRIGEYPVIKFHGSEPAGDFETGPAGLKLVKDWTNIKTGYSYVSTPDATQLIEVRDRREGTECRKSKLGGVQCMNDCAPATKKVCSKMLDFLAAGKVKQPSRGEPRFEVFTQPGAALEHIGLLRVKIPEEDKTVKITSYSPPGSMMFISSDDEFAQAQGVFVGCKGDCDKIEVLQAAPGLYEPEWYGDYLLLATGVFQRRDGSQPMKLEAHRKWTGHAVRLEPEQLELIKHFSAK